MFFFECVEGKDVQLVTLVPEGVKKGKKNGLL